MASDLEKILPGTVLAQRYTIERCLGSGGMGAVYLCADAFLDGDKVAMKVLHPDLVADAKQTQRFMREVQLMRRVDDPNVVRTYDVGSQDSFVYFTMEYVPGKPLESFIEGQSFPKSKIPQLITQVATGLQAIHRANIIHRDLKPANILILDNYQSKITDFGVARPEYSELTAHNEIIGSALYIAPEVWLGTKLTSSVDLYSFGVVLYELTTGVLPFDGDSPASLMRMHLEFKPTPPKELNPEIAPWLNKLILNLLAKTPEERPRDAGELIDYIEMQTGSSKEKVLSNDEFIDSLELEASQFGAKAGNRFSQIKKDKTLVMAKDESVIGRTLTQEIVAFVICLGIAILSTLLLLWAVRGIRQMLYPELELLMSDLSLLSVDTLSKQNLSPYFIVLLVIQLLALGSGLFACLGAATGSLKTMLKVMLLGGMWSFILFFFYAVTALIQSSSQDSIILNEPNGFSFMIAVVKCSFSSLVLDSRIWTIREIIFESGQVFYPEAVSYTSQRAFTALQYLNVFVVAVITFLLGKAKRKIMYAAIASVVVFLLNQEIGGVESTALYHHSNYSMLAAIVVIFSGFILAKRLIPRLRK